MLNWLVLGQHLISKRGYITQIVAMLYFSNTSGSYSGAKKVTEEFNNWMNKKVAYKKQSVMWSYALLLKTRELA